LICPPLMPTITRVRCSSASCSAIGIVCSSTARSGALGCASFHLRCGAARAHAPARARGVAR